MENLVIDFGGGGIMKFEVVEGGVKVMFQAPHTGGELKITSMSVVLTLEECKSIMAWLAKLGE